MDKIVKEENLKDTFPYINNIIIGGETEREHKNVKKFLKVIKKINLAINGSKIIQNVTTLNTLGYCAGNGIIKLDPEWMKLLQEMQIPKDMGTLNKVSGMFVC